MTSAHKTGSAQRIRRFSAWSGLGTLASLWPSTELLPYPHRDETDALRGDFSRIGNDFWRVIEREAARGTVKQD